MDCNVSIKLHYLKTVQTNFLKTLVAQGKNKKNNFITVLKQWGNATKVDETDIQWQTIAGV